MSSNLTLIWEGKSGDGKSAFVVADQNDGWEDLRIEVDTDDCDSEFARTAMQIVIDRVNAFPEIVAALQAISEWNDNPTLEPGLPTELQTLVLSALASSSSAQTENVAYQEKMLAKYLDKPTLCETHGFYSWVRACPYCAHEPKQA